ncbi:MAG: copper homeostasis protein CutC [Parvibaculaceae bacterium]
MPDRIPPLLEVCVDDAAGLVAAVAGGADRIELTSALELGGLTPSPALMALAAEARIPVYVMIRPRAGNFVYSPVEEDQMRREIDVVREIGLSGIVIGAMRGNGRLDVEMLSRFVQHAGGLGTTLHRAFDMVSDQFEALEQAVGIGISRILTSGGKPRAEDALDRIAALVERAEGRIVIMAGSGLTAYNAPAFLAVPGLREFHASCSVDAGGKDQSGMGFGPLPRRRTSSAVVAQLHAALRI